MTIETRRQDKTVCINCGNEMEADKCPVCGLDNHDYVVDWIKETTNYTCLL